MGKKRGRENQVEGWNRTQSRKSELLPPRRGKGPVSSLPVSFTVVWASNPTSLYDQNITCWECRHATFVVTFKGTDLNRAVSPWKTSPDDNEPLM